MGPPKSKVAAALLAFFLGCLGIHNFYLGYTGRGLAQLLLTVLTCGYGAIATVIWAFIEFVLILTGSIKDKFGRPLT
jgi:TM2 domain-containing membrane protein YozV